MASQNHRIPKNSLLVNSTKPNVHTPSTHDIIDGPMMSLINKRIRTFRKKIN
ncbi:hypothetical protein DEO72_LG11g1155 [Vigna unguiculata]|uniref:Uncharacterized protein n=1 Tax=Vigna unguiculata TaxID=3917 RepID=A0A4D6NQU1_VIGUN|nr:hypothetical protein DEO72_LG11g1155 [Vigna unguiculata]